MSHANLNMRRKLEDDVCETDVDMYACTENRGLRSETVKTHKSRFQKVLKRTLQLKGNAARGKVCAGAGHDETDKTTKEGINVECKQ